MRIKRLVAAVLPLLYTVLLAAQTVGVTAEEVWRGRLCAEMDLLLRDELLQTSQLGLCVYDLTDDATLYAHQATQRMRPASTEKIVTAVSALSLLGDSTCFSTRLYRTGAVEGRILRGDVYVVGGFDPFFDEDDMKGLTDALKSLGVDSIAGGIFADVSMKDTLQWGWGWCWDDEMPVLTPLLYKGKDLFMDTFGECLHRDSIAFGYTARGRLPGNAVLLAERKRPMSQVLPKMMKESDNLCAEAVFYLLAASTGKPYASRKEAIAMMESLFATMGHDPSKYVVADGSGVSLYNYLSAKLEVDFLRLAYRSQAVFPWLYSSLPIAGEDGTLRRRMTRGSAKGNVRAKTGTVEGVSSLAGYARAANGHLLAFCILNQGVDSAASAREFQDKICEVLCK